MILIL
ncbi:hypothetical protein ECPA31_3431, partial [Escherichia coli PA31]